MDHHSPGPTRNCCLDLRHLPPRHALWLGYLSAMPYEWIEPTDPDAPKVELHLWPYRSLLRREFVIFIAATALASF